MYSPSNRPSPSGPPTWLHTLETAPNVPSLIDNASSRFAALMRLSCGSESSSAEPISVQFSSPDMGISCSQFVIIDAQAYRFVDYICNPKAGNPQIDCGGSSAKICRSEIIADFNWG